MNTSPIAARRLLGVGAGAAVTAAAVNAAIFGLGRAADVVYEVQKTSTGPKLVNVTDIVSFSLMTFAVGLVAALVAGRVGRPSLRTIQQVGATIAVVSVAMDVPIHATFSAKATLALMHLIVGAAFVIGLQLARKSSTTEAVRHIEPEYDAQALGAAA